ncbi:MAG: electron transport complex subunit RsxC [Paludibacteraceae bacterium]|nr:electron transport complex subunit RsxC [Paludibacteraceae bacterium]
MKTFRRGGIHPADNKLSAGQRIETLPPPAVAVIPLSQHIGAPAQPVVAVGDYVRVGQLIGEPGGPMSAAVHSSVSGKVTAIGEIKDAFGIKQTAITITTEGDDWMPEIDRSGQIKPGCKYSPEEIRQKIADAGIVGLGGACFPTAVKLNPPASCHIDTLLINGVECEPYLTPNYRLMIEHSEEIMVGITLLMRCLKVERALVGIEANKPEAIERFEHIAARRDGIEIVPLKMKYPQGGEKQLIQALTGREVKSGQLPASAGVVVINVATTFAVYEAVQMNKPLIESYLSVSGLNLLKTGNFKVRIGTSMADVMERVSGIPEDTGKIIAGGPMMGRSMIHVNAPVTKRITGITLLSRQDALRLEPQPCIRCTSCMQACPMGLESYLLARKAELKDWEFLEKHHIMDCMECGCCSYVCPSHRPLLDCIRLGKATVGNLIRSRAKK